MNSIFKNTIAIICLVNAFGCGSGESEEMSQADFREALQAGREKSGSAPASTANALAPQDQKRAEMSLQGVPPEARSQIKQNIGSK